MPCIGPRGVKQISVITGGAVKPSHVVRGVSSSKSPAASGTAKPAENAGTLRLGMICLAVASLAPNVAPAPDTAADFPRRPVRIIVPAAPGGGADIIARLIGQQLGKSLGQTFLVDNRPGAANIVGTEIVAKAPPDGYTLIVNRSEERRVGKECRSRWSPYH